jgi:hypothetical protein
MAEAVSLKLWEEQGIVSIQKKVADFVQQFQSMIEVNRDGIPLSIIDPTIISECAMYADTTDDIPEEKYHSSLTAVDFEDGIPVVNGVPLWERLDGERMEYYKIFKEYRDMKYMNENGIGARSMASLSETLNIPGRLISILARIYHWMTRVRCFDMYKEREIALRRRKVAEELENKHAKYSNDLLESAMKYLHDHPAALNPKTALQMVEIGMKYGRISVGLQGDKPGAQSAAVHQTNIAISQSNNLNEADQMVINNVGGGTQGLKDKSQLSAVERKLADSMKEPSNLMSVLHVLTKSGAFEATVKNENKDKNADTDENGFDDADVIDVTPNKEGDSVE